MNYVEATPRSVTDISHCYFYHTIDLPTYGRQNGIWDLIGRFDNYIGNQNLENRTVLDIGTATGFLTFEAEKRGAVVTSFDVGSAEVLSYLPL